MCLDVKEQQGPSGKAGRASAEGRDRTGSAQGVVLETQRGLWLLFWVRWEDAGRFWAQDSHNLTWILDLAVMLSIDWMEARTKVEAKKYKTECRDQLESYCNNLGKK